MSSYTNYLIELPRRCKILINKYFDLEKGNENSYEVTLLLSLAMPIFCFTNEIIKKEFTDSKILQIKKQIEEEKFSESELAKNITDKTKIGITKFLDNFNNSSPIIYSERKVLATISKFRNALSHGNIQFIKSSDNSCITDIIFSSIVSPNDPVKEYNFILIPVEEFKSLLLNWCEFLIKHDKNLEFIPILFNEAA
jgi:hypothetical protein